MENNKMSYNLFVIIGALFGVVTSNTIGGIMGYGNGISNTFFYGGIGYGICALLNKEREKLWHALLIVITGLVIQMIINSLYL